MDLNVLIHREGMERIAISREPQVAHLGMAAR
jgi:hypothetical protein